MRAVIQRVKNAKVIIDNTVEREISEGILIFIGIRTGDTEKDAFWLAEKCANLRIFSDGDIDRFDRSAIDKGVDVMIISQFTLYANCRHGRRPDFTESEKPEKAKELYNFFVEWFKNNTGLKIVTGEFGKSMLVHIINNGPVTLIIDSKVSNK